jgi:hypothetical protein
MSREELLALAEASQEEFADEEEFQRVEKLAMEIRNLFQGSKTTTCIDAFFMEITDEMSQMPPSERQRLAKLCKKWSAQMMSVSEALAGLQKIADEEKACH